MWKLQLISSNWLCFWHLSVKTVTAIHEHHANFFRWYRKNCEYFVFESGAKRVIDFRFNSNYDFGIHVPSAKFPVALLITYTIIYWCTLGLRNGKVTNCVLFSTFSSLIAKCIRMTIQRKTMERVEMTMMFSSHRKHHATVKRSSKYSSYLDQVRFYSNLCDSNAKNLRF